MRVSSPALKSLRIAAPVMLGYFPVAIAFGLLVNQKGLSVGVALALSAFLYAGASQFAALALFALPGTSGL